MIRPVLLCQGFHRAFIDPASALFSESASMRRSICEELVKHARSAGWTVVHSFLDTESVRAAGVSSIQNFAPLPTEPYFRQKSLSAFGTPALERMMSQLEMSPVFLISLAGIGPISATLLDAIERRLMMSVVTDAVADNGKCNVGERDRLTAIETLARACDCAVTSRELMTLAATPLQPQAHQYISRAS
ncbi:MAG: isochorismatase family protein [Hyphomonadaceae bacterium]